MKIKDVIVSTVKSKMFIISLGLVLILFVFDLLGLKLGVSATDESLSLGINAIESAGSQFLSMLMIVPPIFLLIGLLDVWVPRETMMKLMGEKSGVLGIVIAFFLGTMSAGPLVAAFPVAQLMLKKGAKYSNVLFFLTIWASAKLPILFYQATTLGLRFTIYSNLTLILVYLMGTILIEKLLSHEEKENIYTLAQAS